MRNILITHKNCMDGVGVAVAVKYHDLNVSGVTNREIIWCQYGDDAPDVTGADVIIGDFSFEKDILIKMNEQANSLIVIDHHETAEENLKGLDFCKFDMKQSGAVLVWKHLFPSAEQAPPLLQYIQDRDLWSWLLPDSEAVSASLTLLNKYKIDQFMPYLFDVVSFSLIEDGKVILKYQENHINKVTWKPERLPRMMIGGHNVICINSTTLISEIGNKLSLTEPFVAMYFETDKARVFSLRSNAENPNWVNVAEIAKQFGHGGHKHAAAFSIPLPEVVLPEIK